MTYLFLRRTSALGAMIALACAESPRGDSTSGPVSVTTVASGGEHGVEITGVGRRVMTELSRLAPNDSTWPRVFAVYVERDGAVSRTPPVLGRYVADGGRLRFVPRFPFVAGVPYRVDVDTAALAHLAARRPTTGGGSAPPLTHRFSIPAATRERTTRIVAVHPSLSRVPSNLLRWYLEFSAPMQAGNAIEHVHLMDESGREVTGAFLALDQELWDPERRRLTLLFDPGRVKRGIRTNLESGVPLISGRRYRLVVDDSWLDGAGASLASGYEHPFEAMPADRRSPDPRQWRLTTPRAGTQEELGVAFREPLDHALAARMIAVLDADGSPVAGAVRLAEGDSAWMFTPADRWNAGAYSLRVDSALEDVAGNNLVRLFDVDRRAARVASSIAPVTAPVAAPVTAIPFQIAR